jgi:hypothetical protein
MPLPPPPPSTPPPPPLQVYTTTVPQGIAPGGQFSVLINNRSVNVTCPPGVTPGTQIRIRLPESAPKAPEAPAAPSTLHQTFEVTVPAGVRPGQPFALIANGQRVMVHCPYDARPGQKIRFQVRARRPLVAPSLEQLRQGPLFDFVLFLSPYRVLARVDLHPCNGGTATRSGTHTTPEVTEKRDNCVKTPLPVELLLFSYFMTRVHSKAYTANGAA